MSQSAVEYALKTPEGGWRIAGSRVSLDSVVHAYWEGQSPEAICDDFPSLFLEQVHGAIAFYLHNRAEIDEYLRQQGILWDQLAARSRQANSSLLDRLRQRRVADDAAAQSR